MENGEFQGFVVDPIPLGNDTSHTNSPVQDNEGVSAPQSDTSDSTLHNTIHLAPLNLSNHSLSSSLLWSAPITGPSLLRTPFSINNPNPHNHFRYTHSQYNKSYSQLFRI